MTSQAKDTVHYELKSSLISVFPHSQKHEPIDHGLRFANSVIITAPSHAEMCNSPNHCIQ